MKRAEHTPEPWQLDGDTITGRDENGLESPIATLSHYWRARRTDQANGQHVVSCVNALAGYNPEALEELLVTATNAHNVLFRWRISGKQPSYKELTTMSDGLEKAIVTFIRRVLP